MSKTKNISIGSIEGFLKKAYNILKKYIDATVKVSDLDLKSTAESCCHLQVNEVICQKVILKRWEELAKYMNLKQNFYMENHKSVTVTLSQGIGGACIDKLKPKPIILPSSERHLFGTDYTVC